ncbi:adenylate/guanylate cyclase domain-containing protein [Leptospira idonii]|uniref:Adenylate/guanylate cyclase domain-containing protein n=1 Tax=Leptospira idonii TaxID=1193500 RepID=A0A4V3JXZ4_9LEPT|nr:adenylate/guanylate cyclase domain-containing protein [Leptospira idonii]TGN18756.1 hypothetical protein EHS15_15415 [Leptospira idonii]
MNLIVGWKNRIRLASGLVLFFYSFTHLLNHSFGIVSLESLEQGRSVFLFLWRNPFSHSLLILSFLAHLCFAILPLLVKKTWKMSAGEILQISFGFLIPQVLIGHIFATIGMSGFLGIKDSYTYLMLVFGPWVIATDIFLLVLVWVHGCLGIYYWIRYQSWFVKYSNLILVFAVLFPFCAVMGIISAEKEVNLIFADPVLYSEYLSSLPLPPEEIKAYSMALGTNATVGLNLLLGVLFLVRFILLKSYKKNKTIKVSYPGGVISIISPGTTILEASKLGKVAHANVCGGRGRCSTCRVHVESGLADLDPPSPEEAAVLSRISAPHSVRLACQTKPKSDIRIEPLLPSQANLEDARHKPRYLYGVEKEIVVMFADLRGFTSFAEHLLPYDVVFVLNSYFLQVGKEVEKAGGVIDKYMGDGLMAVFGMEESLENASKQAVLAAKNMSEQLFLLNSRLKNEIPSPLKMGIGIHSGLAILGTFGNSKTPTAIGDAVNTASRLESATKDYRCELILSTDVAEHTNLDFTSFDKHQISVRGKKETMTIYAIPSGSQLESLFVSK